MRWWIWGIGGACAGAGAAALGRAAAIGAISGLDIPFTPDAGGLGAVAAVGAAAGPLAALLGAGLARAGRGARPAPALLAVLGGGAVGLTGALFHAARATVSEVVAARSLGQDAGLTEAGLALPGWLGAGLAGGAVVYLAIAALVRPEPSAR